ncbi:hypothetical protein Ciccas_006341, partial [Cichlidogyrus casuarinus]
DYSLQIQNVHVWNEGNYACQVTSSTGRLLERKSAKVSVLLPSNLPKIYQMSSFDLAERGGRLVSLNDSATVKDGEYLYLKCQAINGKPGAKLIWLDNDANLIPDAEYKLERSDRYKENLNIYV